MTGFHREPHTMTRIDISTGVPFDEFAAASSRRRRRSTPPPIEQITERDGTGTTFLPLRPSTHPTS